MEARRSRPGSHAAGFTLVEALIATVVLVTGLVGVAHVLAVATTMHADAGQTTAAAYHARTKLEELAALDASAPAVQVTGADSLSADVPGYYDVPADGITRRWQVDAGPTATTRLVRVRVINAAARLSGARLDVATVIRPW